MALASACIPKCGMVTIAELRGLVIRLRLKCSDEPVHQVPIGGPGSSLLDGR